MNNSTKLHPQHGEMRAFALFFGSSALVALVLRALIGPLLPTDLVQQYNHILWTFFFLVGCGFMAWALERFRQHHLD